MCLKNLRKMKLASVSTMGSPHLEPQNCDENHVPKIKAEAIERAVQWRETMFDKIAKFQIIP